MLLYGIVMSLFIFFKGFQGANANYDHRGADNTFTSWILAWRVVDTGDHLPDTELGPIGDTLPLTLSC